MASLIASPEISISCVGRRGGIPTKLFSKASPRNRAGFRSCEDKEILGSRARVCSSTRYCEVKDLDLERNDEISWQFSAPVKESSSSKQNKDDEEKQNYYVNTGYAIRTLREEFPQIFYKEISFDIYRCVTMLSVGINVSDLYLPFTNMNDIVFKDPLNTFIGIKNYKSIFSALRFYGRIFFKALWIDIVSISQPIDREIMVRWTVHGIPRVPWESHGRFDATSEYKLDKNGKIYEHRVQNIVLNSPPRFRVLAVEELIQSLGSPSTPKPTYFEILSSSLVRSMPLLVRFTWVRYYLAFKLALAWRCAGEELVS